MFARVQQRSAPNFVLRCAVWGAEPAHGTHTARDRSGQRAGSRTRRRKGGPKCTRAQRSPPPAPNPRHAAPERSSATEVNPTSKLATCRRASVPPTSGCVQPGRLRLPGCSAVRQGFGSSASSCEPKESMQPGATPAPNWGRGTRHLFTRTRGAPYTTPQTS